MFADPQALPGTPCEEGPMGEGGGEAEARMMQEVAVANCQLPWAWSA